MEEHHSSAGHSRRTRSAVRKEQETKDTRGDASRFENTRKQQKMLFTRRHKTIGQNDIIVNPQANKIKIEGDNGDAAPRVVKRERDQSGAEDVGFVFRNKKMKMDASMDVVDCSGVEKDAMAESSGRKPGGNELPQTRGKKKAAKIEELNLSRRTGSGDGPNIDTFQTFNAVGKTETTEEEVDKKPILNGSHLSEEEQLENECLISTEEERKIQMICDEIKCDVLIIDDDGIVVENSIHSQRPASREELKKEWRAMKEALKVKDLRIKQLNRELEAKDERIEQLERELSVQKRNFLKSSEKILEKTQDPPAEANFSGTTSDCDGRLLNSEDGDEVSKSEVEDQHSNSEVKGRSLETNQKDLSDIAKELHYQSNPIFLATMRGETKEKLEHLVKEDVETLWSKTVINGDAILHVAASAGNIEALGFFLALGADVNSKDACGISPLIRAMDATKNVLAMIKLLIDNEADINTVDEKGNTVLFQAIMKGASRDVLKVLISSNDTWKKTRNSDGGCILHVAVQAENLEALKYLIIKFGENGVNFKDSNGRSPLIQAARRPGNNFILIAKELIRSGAKINMNYKGRNTALHYLTPDSGPWGSLENIKLLMKHGAARRPGYPNLDCNLHLAAQHAHLDLICYFISKGTDVNTKDSKGKTPLIRAALMSNSLDFIGVVKLLLEKGADKNAVDVSGNNVLFTATDHGRPVSELEALADLDVQWENDNNQGESILHMAAHSGRIEAVKYFISKGASINSKNKKQETPFLFAVRHCKQKNLVDMLQVLVEGGAKVNAIDKKGNNALMIAASEGRSKAVVEHLIALGCQWKHKNARGDTILHAAASGGNTEVCSLFLAKGPSEFLNSRNAYKATPFLCASNAEIAKLLADAGADINAVDVNWNNAVILAVKRGPMYEYHVKQLIALGCDWKKPNKKGETARQIGNKKHYIMSVFPRS